MGKPMSSFVLSVLFLVLFFDSSFSIPVTYNVLSLGAKSDGQTDSSNAFLDAWSKVCDSAEAATIYVPPGRFLLGKVEFKGQCKNSDITLNIDGTLVAPSDYNVIGDAGNWLIFEHVDGVSINGGTLDGQGASLWTCKKTGDGCPTGTTVAIINHLLKILYFKNALLIFLVFICRHWSLATRTILP